jgi:hypothetical protein
MEDVQLSTRTCAHHDVIEVKYVACRESINALETLHRNYITELKEIRADQSSLKEDFAALSGKVTLIVLLAAPIWAALTSVAVKFVAGINITGG